MAPRCRGTASPKPMCNLHLSDSEIMRILTLAFIGQSSQAIADKVGHSQSSLSRVTRTYNYETFESRTLTRICKCKTTIHQDCILLRTAKINDDRAYHDIINISSLKISRTMSPRHLKEVTLFSSIFVVINLQYAPHEMSHPAILQLKGQNSRVHISIPSNCNTSRIYNPAAYN